MLADENKPGWLKIDFDRWQAEDDSEEEEQDEITVLLHSYMHNRIWPHVSLKVVYIKLIIKLTEFAGCVSTFQN